MNSIDTAQIKEIEIRLLEGAGDLNQDEESFELTIDGETRRVGFHDYAETFSIPGVYELLFYDKLKCDSPRTVCGLLAEQLRRDGREPEELRALDVGAGNGMVGEELRELGVDEVVGVDIIEEAAEAVERDRPGVYSDYYVLDLTAIPAPVHEELGARRFNCLTSVAAVGFGDIPPDAFAEAYNLIEPGGLIAFSLRDKMVTGEDSSGFSRLIDTGIKERALDVKVEHTYRHRLNTKGEPLYYVAIVAEKARDLPISGS